MPIQKQRFDGSDARSAERVQDAIAWLCELLDIGANHVRGPTSEIRVNAIVPLGALAVWTNVAQYRFKLRRRGHGFSGAGRSTALGVPQRPRSAER